VRALAGGHSRKRLKTTVLYQSIFDTLHEVTESVVVEQLGEDDEDERDAAFTAHEHRPQ